MRALIYIRVSTNEQAESGLGLEAQLAACKAACAARGWPTVAVIRDDESARSLRRPRLIEALGMLEAGEADVLVVARLSRLTRSVKDFCLLIEQANRRGYSILSLDSPADPTTAGGLAMQQMMVVFSEYERREISSRTRLAMAALRARGVRLGRPRVLPDEVRIRIKREHEEDGRSYSEIARRLTADGVATAHGAAKWSHVVVRKIALAA